jgi:hypothetical protein
LSPPGIGVFCYSGIFNRHHFLLIRIF